MIALLAEQVSPIALRHYEWSTADKELSQITDITWNYCDLKCLYLENELPGIDTVVVTFQDPDTGEEIADCYLRHETSYTLWS